MKKRRSEGRNKIKKRTALAKPRKKTRAIQRSVPKINKPKINKKTVAHKVLIDERKISRLQSQLDEAQETLSAIRNGQVDAVVVNGVQGTQIYTLVGADQPYRVYIEQMQEGAATLAPDGLILYANRRFAEMVGVPMARIISTSIQNYLPAPAWQEISDVLGPGEPVVKHECILACDSALPVYLTASRLSLPDQDVLCLIVTDLTQHKESIDLRMAKELAERSNMAKDNFLAALSHELRTPLTPVLIAAEALQNDPEIPPRLRDELALIRRNVELEARLIDDLLDLTRIARGKLQLHPAEMDIQTELQRAIDICQPDIRSKGLHCTLHLDAPQFKTVGDPVRLQQVFWNLIRNAVKFTPPGGSIQIWTDNPGPDEIRVRVMDNGVGFDPSLAGEIFAPFEQGGQQITRDFGGLGLGLAICRSIVHSHGGVIEGTSPGHNRGATFSVRLPLRALAPQYQSQTSAPSVNSAEDRAIRILLVEDHPDTRASMAKLLRREHLVQIADSAAQALSIASQQSFDLVISDLGLPDRSGLELMRELRELYNLKGICISGFGMEDDISNSKEAGFVQHLTKPISLDRLQSAIREVAELLEH
ncbi:MAG TPA: ATP-binding protein [Tepidisphaeraceae bacterium]